LNLQVDDKEYKSRLRTLHIVLVLSLVANGLGVFSNFVLSLPSMRNMIHNNMQLIPEVLHETYEMMFSIPSAYYIATAILSTIAFIGCLRMWQVKRLGFHYYTLSKLLLIATPLVFIGRQYLNIGDTMMSLLFIVFYYISLRTLGAFGKETPNEDNSNESHNDFTDSNTF